MTKRHANNIDTEISTIIYLLQHTYIEKEKEYKRMGATPNS